MDTVVYFVFGVCLLNGLTCHPSNSTITLVLNDLPCNDMNTINNTAVKYEPVSYDDVYGIEKDILELLSDGDSVRLSGYGVRNSISIKGCYKLDTYNNKTDTVRIGLLNENGNEQQTQPFQHCIKSKTEYAGISESSCGCVPIPLVEWQKERLIKQMQYSEPCRTNSNKNKSYDPNNMYMFVYRLSNPFKNSFSRHILCSYIIVNQYTKTTFDRYGRCDIETDGFLCTTSKYINDTENCEALQRDPIKFSPRTSDSRKEYMCVSSKGSYKGCEDKSGNVCPESQNYKSNIWNMPVYNMIYHRMEQKLHSVYSTFRWKTLLYIVDKPINNYTHCISLKRYVNRLFVELMYCKMKMKHLCWKIDSTGDNNTTSNEDRALHIPLIAGGAFAFILIVTAVAIVIIIRRHTHMNTDSYTSDTMDRNIALELHPIGPSSDDGCSNDAGTVPGTMGASNVSMAASNVAMVASNVSLNASSDSEPTAGEVPGKIPGGYNCHYTTDGSNC